MGAAVDHAALAQCIRIALYAHLDEYVEDECAVTVYEGEGPIVMLEVDGFHFGLVLTPAGDLPADAALA